MNFVLGGRTYSAKLAVTRAVDEMILGIDFLSKYSATWDFGAGRLYLDGQSFPLQQRTAMDSVRRICTAESVCIPPMSQADVPVTVAWPNLHPTHMIGLLNQSLLMNALQSPAHWSAVRHRRPLSAS